MANLSRRGNAEVETLLVIPLLLCVLTLIAAAARIGAARLANSYEVADHVYGQVTTGREANPSSLTPPPGFTTVFTGGLPDLPNRFEDRQQTKTIPYAVLSMSPSAASMTDRALFLDAPWHIANWPDNADQAALRDWFETYANQEATPLIRDSLGMRPAWMP